MDLAPLGSLEATGPEGKLIEASKAEKEAILHQCLSALHYLHDLHHTTHRDISTANILIQQRQPYIHVQLADFGLSKNAARLNTLCGNLTYMAPEVRSGRAYTSKVDVWSLATVLLHISGYLRLVLLDIKRPWELNQWCQEVSSAAVDMFQARDPMATLIRDMLSLNPKHRLAAKDALNTANVLGFDKWTEQLALAESSWLPLTDLEI